MVSDNANSVIIETAREPLKTTNIVNSNKNEEIETDNRSQQIETVVMYRTEDSNLRDSVINFLRNNSTNDESNADSTLDSINNVIIIVYKNERLPVVAFRLMKSSDVSNLLNKQFN